MLWFLGSILAIHTVVMTVGSSVYSSYCEKRIFGWG